MRAQIKFPWDTGAMVHDICTHDVVIRRLHPIEIGAICDHFLRLDLTSRRARFCGSVNDACVKDYANCIFQQNAIICGAFVDGHLRGVAELRGVSRGWSVMSEAAFCVEDGWQDMGIGDALFERLFAIAQNRGVRMLQLTCLKENGRIKHLATKRNAKLKFLPEAVEAVLFPYWPTPFSILKEMMAEIKGFAHFVRGARMVNS